MLLKNKLIIIVIFVLLATPVLSDNEYWLVYNVLQCLKRSLYDFLINPTSGDLLKVEELRDLITFYISIEGDPITVDCSQPVDDGESERSIKAILEDIPNCEFTASCIDGTIFAECSTDYPKYCYAGTLIDKCSECGCDSGDYCNMATDQCQGSSDYIKCSVQYGGICSSSDYISSSDYVGSSDYVEARYCIGNGVYRNYTRAVCRNPNKPSSYCGIERLQVLLEECDVPCINGRCRWEDILTCAQLQQMQDNLGMGYRLTDNIDCAGFPFVPVGDDAHPFTGNLMGNGKSIRDLTITTGDLAGLFGVLDEGALISNIVLQNVDIDGSYPVGAIAAVIKDGKIEEISAFGEVTGTSFISAGGLAGEIFKGIIDDSSFEGDVTGIARVGGVVGMVQGPLSLITNTYSKGSVRGTQKSIGGLAGDVLGPATITDSYSESNVIHDDPSYSLDVGLGGLVGYAKEDSYIIRSYSTGTITGHKEAGGLVGMAKGSTITDSYSLSVVNIPGKDYIGGLIGIAEETRIINSYSKGDVIGKDIVGGLVGNAVDTPITDSYSDSNVNGNMRIGGLVGLSSCKIYLCDNNKEKIINSYSTGNVVGTGDYVGGLVGKIDHSIITGSHSTSDVTGKSKTGGLVGHLDRAEIKKSYSKANTIINGQNQVGGLVGFSEFRSTITDSYSTSNVNGVNQVGGLVGSALLGTEITKSYSESTAGITAERNEVGGLVGKLDTSTITDSYSTSNVNGVNQVGGLVGNSFDSSQTNTYSTGNVVATAVMAGGLIGSATGSQQIINSYSTGEVSGITPPPLGGLVGIFSGGTFTNNYWYNSLNNCCGSGTCADCTKASGVNDFYNPNHAVYTTDPIWDFTEIWQATITYPTLK